MLYEGMRAVEGLISYAQEYAEEWGDYVLVGCAWTVGAMSLPIISLVGNHYPSFAGPLCASVIICLSSVGAFYAAAFLRRIEQDTLSKVVALAIVFFATAFCTPLMAKFVFNHQIVYLPAVVYASAGVLAFFFSTSSQ